MIMSEPTTKERKEAIMSSVRQELALSNVQQLINGANERCFKTCITKPAISLSSADQTCLSQCFDRYLEAFTIVRHAYLARIAQERQDAQARVF
ncbi:zf-Tim10-DDP domain-containing protein [Mycena indigotica]|uniref:Mitochondrial import inner membrane translocase subunit n=1 Tax=Mycena indigotica TaxID=2126181 RepID=A0A8H6T764_9AGAR|nr:zf-Tim10-DDP domain-containing protein [Mycena indigotica]KAF7312186.1 zf-Tim10-DDP domain-containing protein [Mycena indigotica]